MMLIGIVMVAMMFCGVRVLIIVLILDGWYCLDSIQVPLFPGNLDSKNGVPSLIFSKRLTGQIILSIEISGYESLYICIIPDENRVYND